MTRDRLLTVVCGAALAAILTTGLVQAQSTPAPAAQPGALPPPVDPAEPPSEEPPPAPGEVSPAVVPPAEPLPPLEPEPTPKADAPDGDEEKAAPPPQPVAPPPGRLRHQAAIIQALDKITAETIRFEAKVGRPVRYKGLVFTVRSCETTAADEPMRDAAAYLEVRSEPRLQSAEKRPSRQVFRGWTFASSPGLNPIEHPVYDAWLIACKTSAPVAAG